MVVRALLWDKPRGDGKHNIKIYLYAFGRKKYITTKHFICLNDWDADSRLVLKTHKNFEHINNTIKGLMFEIEKKALINPEVKVNRIVEAPVKQLSFSQFLSEYYEKTKSNKNLTKKGQPIMASSGVGMRTHLNRLISFNKTQRIDFDDVNPNLYNKYVNYLRHDYEIKVANKKEIKKGLAENTISKSVENFVRLMKEAWIKKLHDNRDALKFTYSRINSEQIALTEKEINAIMKVILPKHLEAERDRFYVSYNFLLRFNDSIHIEKTDIISEGKEYFLDSVHEKTHKKVVIPVFKKTLAILKKHDYSLPKTTNQESNWKLKEIGRLAGIDNLVTINEVRNGKIIKNVFKKYELITTHTTRRSMATNLYLNGFELKEIQLMGGWTNTRTLELYLKIDGKENAIKAAKHPFFAKSK